MYSSKKTTPGILHFVKGKKNPKKQKTNKKQKPSKIPRESEQKNMFSNLKWSRVFSSSWTSTAVWCQQNWAEACGLWARCCCGVTTPRWLWMGVQGRPQCKPTDCLPQDWDPAPNWNVSSFTRCHAVRSAAFRISDGDRPQLTYKWARTSPASTWPDSLHRRREEEKKKATFLDREASCCWKRKKKITLLPHVPLACDQLWQLLIVYIPGKKMPCSIKSSQSLLQVITKV